MSPPSSEAQHVQLIVRMTGERIKEMRQRRGLSQAEFARRMNVRAPTASAWESGKALPHIRQIYRIAEMLGGSFDYLNSGIGSAAEVASPLQIAASSNDPVTIASWQTHLESRITKPVVPSYKPESFDHYLIIEDDAMAPAILKEDAWIYREIPHIRPSPGDFVVAHNIDSGVHVVRQYRQVSDRKRPGVSFELVPSDTRLFAAEEQSRHIELVGVITEIAHRVLKMPA